MSFPSVKDIPALRQDALTIFKAGLAAVEPGAAVRRMVQRTQNKLSIGDQELDLQAFARIGVLGAGKAAIPMARAMAGVLGEALSWSEIVVPHGSGALLPHIRIHEAAHPVPDENGRRAAQALMQRASAAGGADLLFFLVSGGGSALLPLPAQGITLADKKECIHVLLACGAAIPEINAIRKHLSAIKGGFLARAAHPATVITLMLSDVAGDDPGVIASGPTVPDESTFTRCQAVLDKYHIADRMPPAVRRRIQDGLAGKIAETPKPGDQAFDKARHFIIANNFKALQACQHQAQALGYHTLILSSRIEGETSVVARMHAAMAREIAQSGNPLAPPACLLSGGETTVTLTGNGLGGRNQQFVLDAAMELHGEERVVIFSAGTDGIDGPTDAAGAIADGLTVARAQAKGLCPDSHLRSNDAYPFFAALGDLIKTGPTHTNVMDLHIILVG